MDEYAVASQSRALAAIESGFLAKQIVPLLLLKEVNENFETDEAPREGITLERLAKLKPAFQEGGKVTAGIHLELLTAAALIVGDKDGFAQQGVTPEARLVDWAVVGVPRV